MFRVECEKANYFLATFAMKSQRSPVPLLCTPMCTIARARARARARKSKPQNSKPKLLSISYYLLSQERGSGLGALPAGFDLSSGNGINSLLSLGGKMILPCFQSSFACSMRSFLEDTKFHQINRSPNGSPPNNIIVVCSFASKVGSACLLNTNICPA
jgi:hypothetical protein